MTMTSSPLLPPPEWTAVSQAIGAASSILIVTHVQPDGDAIGSLTALGGVLIAAGKTVTLAVDGGVPSYLRFTPLADTVKSSLDAGDFDLMISVDASDEERTGQCGVYGRAHAQRVINVDHHATNTAFGDLKLVVPTAVSATEVVFEWMAFAGYPLSQGVAKSLLIGLVTDTIGFRTNNVTPRVLEIAQVLMREGAPLHEIMTRTLGTISWRSVLLWRWALTTVALEKHVVSANITQSMLKRARLQQPADAGGFVSFLNSTEEARIAVVFKEQEGRVEISLRARPGYDVGSIAFALGGGGHTLASGATLTGTLEEVRQRVMPLLLAAANPKKQ
jgi:phosphoesterase RecJ-like protein